MSLLRWHTKAIRGWQFIWWWERPRFESYEYPCEWNKRGFQAPIFKGLYLGIFEIRYFPKFYRVKEGESHE